MLASVDIKLTQIGQHRQSRTGLFQPKVDCSTFGWIPGERTRPEFDDRAGPLTHPTHNRFPRFL